MKKKIIKIDQEKCIGCGLCVDACHEGAIGMVDGKAVLLREDYCDGLGDCLPVCPTDAISFEEKEIEAPKTAECGCPGGHAHRIARRETAAPAVSAAPRPSELTQWPVQIKLAPVNAPYFDGADLLIAADCSAYAYADFHGDFIAGRITLIGCPKLDQVEYADKLTEIFRQNDIHSITVVRMQVPCCAGIAGAAVEALGRSGKQIPLRVVTMSTDGRIINEQ